MSLVVNVEIDGMNRCARVLVLKNSFCTIAKWDDGESFCTYWNTFCQVVHFAIGNAFRRNGTLHPGIEDACSVDAEKNAEACLVCCMINVCEGVDARQLIIVDFSEYAIHNT